VPVIFTNPAGAPELACDECGCRWFDRQANCCYECGAPVSETSLDEFHAALERFAARARPDSPLIRRLSPVGH
jgi:hypothetical protein